MTLREMMARMDASEYQEWAEFYNARPFGFERREQRHGDLMSSLWALHGGTETPKRMRDPAQWKYSLQSSLDDMDPETEAQMMLAKIGG